MMHVRAICLLLAAIWIGAAHQVPAETRVALVIGNGNYSDVPPLPNPANDARLITQTLTKLGFAVSTTIDASHADMRRDIKAFGEELEKAGTDAIGLFFYAGHAVQIAGANYLLPVDARIGDESDISIEGVHLDLIVHQMTFAQSGTSIVVLDACRDNPFDTTISLPSGLAQIRAPRNSFIAYATEPGGIAWDGEGTNSPYSLALSQTLLSPDQSIETVFKAVRRQVLSATDNRQSTWESSSLTKDLYLTRSRGTVPITEPAPSKIDWEALAWNEMTEAQRTHWQVLGWTGAMWAGDADPPASSDQDFADLSEDQQGAVRALGYSQEDWDAE